MVYFQTPLPPNSTTQYPHHHRKTILLDQNLDKQQQQSSSTSPSSSSSSSPKKRKWPDHDHMSSLHHHQTQLRTNNNKSDLMTSSLDLHLNNKNPPYSTIPSALSDSSKGSLNLAFDQPAAHQVVHNFYYSSPATRFHSNNNNITQQEEIPKTATTTSSSANHMISLDLALNLPSSSSSTPNSQDVIQLLKSTPTPNKKQISKPNPNRRSELTITAAAAATDDKHDRDTKSINTAARSTLALFSSSPAFDKRSDRKVIDPQQEEMVAAACMRCHMLVMMCKSSPSCPNCKFMHPPDHTLPSLMLNPTLSLSC